MQLRYPTSLSVQEYVSQKAWVNATLDGCPSHPGGGCRFHRHGTYRRETRHGPALVTRYRCVESRTTFSLLPDCLAAGLSGSLDECERVVAAIEDGATLQAAAAAVRGAHAVESAGMRRWARRRLDRVLVCLTTLIPMYPDLLGGCAVRVADVRLRLGTDHALTGLRGRCEGYLPRLPSPVGFRPP